MTGRLLPRWSGGRGGGRGWAVRGVMAAVAVAAAVFLFLPGGAPLRAEGTTITVNTAEDELRADNDCSLREALQAANNNLEIDQCPAGSVIQTDVIVFDESLDGTPITLRLDGAGEDDNATGDLDIAGGVVIRGNGPEKTIIQACEVSQIEEPCPSGRGVRDRVFDLTRAFIYADIVGLTVRHGFSPADEGGGGIRITNTYGPLRLFGVVLLRQPQLDVGGRPLGDHP